jgi:ubiquinol-cytochrome c reductase cytochrome c subunit
MAGRVPFSRALPAVVVVGLAAVTFALARPDPLPRAAAQTLPSPTAIPSATAPPSTAGGLLYLRDCAWCHGNRGQGSIDGPPLTGSGAASADFMLSTGRMPITKVETEPPRKPVTYSAEQIRSLVAFVASLGNGPPVPKIDLSTGDLAMGEELYQDNCTACHGSTGSGATLTSGLIAPSLRDSTPLQVAEAVRLGGQGLESGHMPRFGPDTLSDAQVASIALYVQYLRHPQDRGGGSLGHFGPIPEGLVAWAVGLLAMVLATRWIGEKG